MSTVSASSYDISSTSMKRKRGRPRKDEVSGLDSNSRVPQNPSSNAGLVGQEVSGSFVGVFDAGYLLTVKVGNSGPIMSGLVFDPHLSVPISDENDVAPHLPMLRRNYFSPPTEEDFINQGTVSSQADTVPKNLMKIAPRRGSHVPQAASETMRPTKTLKIFLEGPAETSYNLQPQAKNEDTPVFAGMSGISKPSNDYNPSLVSISMSLEASKDVPADISNETPFGSVSKISDAHVSSEPLNIPKTAVPTITETLPFRIAPCAVFQPLEASLTTPKANLDEQKSPVSSREADFEVSQVLDNKSIETQGMKGENLSQKSVVRSEELKVSNSPTDYNSISEIRTGAEPHIAVAEKLDDGPTVSETSIFEPEEKIL